MKTPTLKEVKQKYLNAKEIRNVYGKRIIKKELKPHSSEYKDFIFCWNNDIILWENGEYAEIISYKDEGVNEGVNINIEGVNTPKHYDNSKGTLYKVATERNWNPYLFDIVKRLERAEKKGEFKTDLEKSINVIKLWLKEYEVNN